MMVLFQNKLIYLGYLPPGSRHEPHTADKQMAGLVVRKVEITTADRVRLRGFTVEKEEGKAKEKDGPVVVYFQGNAGNMIHRLGLFRTMVEAVPELTVVGICYRGYGSSSGRASERGLERDAAAMMAYVKAAYPVARPIYMYGHSLGGAVAVQQLVRDNKSGCGERIRGLVLENTYTSIEDMVRALYPRYTPYPWLAKYFLWNRWPTLRRISQIHQPILFLCSERDELVPPEHTQRLYDAASQSTHRVLVRFTKSTHMDIFLVEPQLFQSTLRSFFLYCPHDTNNNNNNKQL